MTSFPCVAAAVALVLSAVACTAPSSFQDTEPTSTAGRTTSASVGFGVLAGAAIAEDETGAEPDLEGSSFGARLDLSFPLDREDRLFELGVRTSLTAASVEPEILPVGTSAEVEVTQFAIAPLARFWLTKPDADVRPYIEGFVGGHRSDVDATATVGSVSVSSSDGDSGLFAGAGFGIGFRAAESARVVLGFEWAHSKFDDLEELANAYQAHVGARFEF